jgi:hypothetical protein
MFRQAIVEALEPKILSCFIFGVNERNMIYEVIILSPLGENSTPQDRESPTMPTIKFGERERVSVWGHSKSSFLYHLLEFPSLTYTLPLISA